MRKRIVLSQNFIKDGKLADRLVNESSIDKDDCVLEIGAGVGTITQGLVKKSKKVVAFEIDKNLFNKLNERFKRIKNLELRNEDFLHADLPAEMFKVFSNIPFNITAAVIRKLTQPSSYLQDAFLIVQKEAAEKYVGIPYINKNSQIAVLLYPRFEFSVIYNFSKDDFFPRPSVAVVLLRIKRKEPLLLKENMEKEYQDFVAYSFNQFAPNIISGLSNIFDQHILTKTLNQIGISPNARPSDIENYQWLKLFQSYMDFVETKKRGMLRGSYLQQLNQQSRLEKIHRTRTDKNWKERKNL